VLETAALCVTTISRLLTPLVDEARVIEDVLKPPTSVPPVGPPVIPVLYLVTIVRAPLLPVAVVVARIPYPSVFVVNVAVALNAAFGDSIKADEVEFQRPGLLLVPVPPASFTLKVQPAPELTQLTVVEALGVEVEILVESKVPKAVVELSVAQLIDVVIDAVTVTAEEVAAVAGSG